MAFPGPRRACALALLAFACAGAPPALAADELDGVDRARVQAAVRAGDERVTMLIAAADGRSAQVASDLQALGAEVETRAARIDYVKASVPIGRADVAAALPGVRAADVDGVFRRDEPPVGPEGQAGVIPQDPPGSATPQDNPYLPIQDTGVTAFTDDSPDVPRDGRGARLAILDSGIDLDHPAFAETSNGRRKVIAWHNANAPGGADGTWVSVTGSHTGAFTDGGIGWSAPVTGGPYAFGILKEGAGDLAQGDFGGDVDRDGTKNETIGVLRRVGGSVVLVDTDGDRSFTDEQPMTDYAAPDWRVGHLGTDKVGTTVRETVPFTVTTDEPGFVSVNLAGSGHGTHVAGIAAGNGFFGGAMTGAAPGAQLLAVKVCLTTSACTAAGLIDGMEWAAAQGADVANLSVGGLPSLNDGDNARAAIYDSITEAYGMQIVISAGNSGPGANTVGDPSVAARPLSVAASITQDTWLSNYGVEAGGAFGIMPFSSTGPSEDGGLKPELAAPGSAVSSVPLWQPGAPTPGTYPLPPGYAMFNGTSMAAPQVAGAAAVLVGAYKADHDGEPPTPAQLRTAMLSGADHRPEALTTEQGAGLLDVPAAWSVLDADGEDPSTIVASVPVDTVLSDQLRIPGQGRGIHDREGVVLGTAYTRTYTLTRTTGAEGSRPFAVSWDGDPATFDSADQVDLPLDEPVELPVTIHPSTPGIHSALLRLDDPDTVGVDHVASNAVYVPQPVADGKARLTGTLGRGEERHLLVRVPPGTGALSVDLQGGGKAATQAQLRFLRFSPRGPSLEDNGSGQCFEPPVAGGGCSSGSPTSRTAIAPAAGTWDVVVESRRSSTATSAPFVLEATLLRAQVSPTPLDLQGQTLRALTRTYTVANAGRAFTGRLRGEGALSSEARRRQTLTGPGDERSYDVTIPAEVSGATFRTSDVSRADADLDLYVDRCEATCTEVGKAVTGSAEEAVSLTDPPAGLYRVTTVGFDVPVTTSFDVVDRYTSATLGRLESTDANQSRAAGKEWTATATLTPLALPAAGRTLVGDLSVVTDDGIVAGTGRVTFRDTTPPTTTITGGPTGTVATRTPAFAFAADEPGVTFRCGVDGAATVPCTSSWAVAALADGQHTFTVAGTDGAGNAESTPATRTFTVAATPAAIPSPSPSATPPPVTPADPPAACTVDRVVRLEVRRGKAKTGKLRLRRSVKRAKVVRARLLSPDGEVLSTPRRKGRRVTVDLRGRPPGTYRVRVTVQLRSGKRVKLSTRLRGRC